MKATKLSSVQIQKELAKKDSKFDKSELNSILLKRGIIKNETDLISLVVTFLKKGAEVSGKISRTFVDKRDNKNYSIVVDSLNKKYTILTSKLL
jgi:hypothetical protein